MERVDCERLGGRHWEEIKILEDTKEGIFEQIRKKRLQNQKVFENIYDLDGDFRDIQKMIGELDEVNDQEAIENLRFQLGRLQGLDAEFYKNLASEKNNENNRWGQMTRLEDVINQLMKNIESKTKELEEIEEKIEAQRGYASQMNGRFEADNLEYTKLLEAVTQKEKKIKELENLYLIETHEIESLKREIDSLTKKKLDKEMEIHILEEREEREFKYYEETKEQLEELRKNENRKKMNVFKEEFEITSSIEDLNTDVRNFERRDLPIKSAPKDNLTESMFLVAVVIVLLIIIFKI